MNPRDEPMSDAEYVRNKGLTCPYCESTDIEGQGVEICLGAAVQEVGCNDCDKDWIDLYNLVGYEES